MLEGIMRVLGYVPRSRFDRLGASYQAALEREYALSEKVRMYELELSAQASK